MKTDQVLSLGGVSPTIQDPKNILGRMAFDFDHFHVLDFVEFLDSGFSDFQISGSLSFNESQQPPSSSLQKYVRGGGRTALPFNVDAKKAPS